MHKMHRSVGYVIYRLLHCGMSSFFLIFLIFQYKLGRFKYKIASIETQSPIHQHYFARSSEFLCMATMAIGT